MTHTNGTENMLNDTIHEIFTAARRGRTLDALLDAHKAGIVYNVDWNEIKRGVNGALEHGYKVKVVAPYLALEHEAGDRGVPRAIVLDLYYSGEPQIHVTKEKKIAKLETTFGNHWMVKAARDYLESVRPLIELANEVKATLTKARKPRTTERETPERTIENTGTCAVCGMNVKRDKRGNIVDHGYRVSWHERQGGCYGVGYPPIELSPKGAENYLAMIRPMLERAEKVVAEFAAKYDEDTLSYGIFRLPEDERKRYTNADSTVRHAGRDVKRFEKIIAEWKATDLPDAK